MTCPLENLLAAYVLQPTVQILDFLRDILHFALVRALD